MGIRGAVRALRGGRRQRRRGRPLRRPANLRPAFPRRSARARAAAPDACAPVRTAASGASHSTRAFRPVEQQEAALQHQGRAHRILVNGACKRRARDALVESIVPGRRGDLRPPTAQGTGRNRGARVSAGRGLRQGPHRPAGREQGRLPAAVLGWSRAVAHGRRRTRERRCRGPRQDCTTAVSGPGRCRAGRSRCISRYSAGGAFPAPACCVVYGAKRYTTGSCAASVMPESW